MSNLFQSDLKPMSMSARVHTVVKGKKTGRTKCYETLKFYFFKVELVQTVINNIICIKFEKKNAK